MGVNGKQIQANDATPQTVAVVICHDEAAFNAVLALNGGIYWAQAYNEEGKKGTQLHAVLQGFLFEWFMQA
jgi:hypothetical protein